MMLMKEQFPSQKNDTSAAEVNDTTTPGFDPSRRTLLAFLAAETVLGGRRLFKWAERLHEQDLARQRQRTRERERAQTSAAETHEIRTHASTAAEDVPAETPPRENTPEHEGRFRTVAWRILHGADFGAADGPDLARAAYEAQLHHLQTYHERNERNDFLDAAYRITQTDTDAIRNAFARYGFSGAIAFGLPIQESFFRTNITSGSGALGPYQIKERTASAIIAQTPELHDAYADLTATDAQTAHALRTKLLTDPVFSARVAAAILADEYRAFGDEALALTAYNTGRSLKLTTAERAGITYDTFTALMAQKIADIAADIRTNHATYVIRTGDTFSKLRRMFPQIAHDELLSLVGGSTQLRAGAATRIPLPDAVINRRILRAAHIYIEPLEYAAKVRAAGDALRATQHYAYLVEDTHTI